MNPDDLHQTLDAATGTFLALMFMEVLVKPIAVRTGKWMLKNLDKQYTWIPNWLYTKEH